MISKVFDVGVKPCSVQGILTLCGQDICLIVGGGTLPHVGAIAVAEPRDSLKQDGTRSASCSVLCMYGHKDDVLAREAALKIAAFTNSRTLVAVGLHIDNISAVQMEMLSRNFGEIIQQSIEYLK